MVSPRCRKPISATGTPMNLRFPGQWFQSESGLHQNWMRDNDPTLGRYVQGDPLGLVDGSSIYGYVWRPCLILWPTGRLFSVDFKLLKSKKFRSSEMENLEKILKRYRHLECCAECNLMDANSRCLSNEPTVAEPLWLCRSSTGHNALVRGLLRPTAVR
ncbi:RHS repeat-associated core domain-containing protein [Litoreibacter meonggei]|uniref:RHS repeat-associated core domain-containing protein n=1 Tax=Litoreibacter meonggei TaxID=1049199 RepID=UPI000EB55D1B